MTEKTRHVRPMRVTAAPAVDERSLAHTYLNCAPRFWDVYRMAPGVHRRKALLALFETYSTSQLPVNGHYQANMIDPDLARLLKQGVLVRFRPGARQRVGNRKSSKRQTYLVLAKNLKR